MSEIITRWKKVTEQLSHKLSRRPKIKEVAKKMKMSEGRVRQLNEIATKASSLDAPIGQDGSGQFMDLIEDKNIASPKDELSKMFQKERINSLLELISEREREIINLRFGLKDGFSHTLGQTAEVFGITRERVRQIENAAMRKLKIYLAHREGVQVSTLEEDKKRKRTLRKKRAKRRINQKNKRNSKKSKKKKSKRRKKSKKKIREKKRKTKQGRTKKKRSKKKKSKK
jgi:hypothetical protein